MSQRRAKRVRHFTRLRGAFKTLDPDVAAMVEELIYARFTPRERRRAEAVVARKAPKAEVES